MQTIFNFGDPHKDFNPVAKKILGNYAVTDILITNNRLFYNAELQIVDAAYGPSLVLDSLTMMKKVGRLNPGDQVMFLGSMGSFCPIIRLDDLVIPIELRCAYFGNKGKVIRPNQFLWNRLEQVLTNSEKPWVRYKHGSVMAVFDPTTDHKKYQNSLYGKNVEGVDCAESYIGLKFCEENGLTGAVLLYCSDTPTSHIGNIPKEEFDKRALKKDLELHRISKKVLLESN